MNANQQSALAALRSVEPIAARLDRSRLDVPPEVDVAGVVGRLQTQLRDGLLVWEWADPRPS